MIDLSPEDFIRMTTRNICKKQDDTPDDSMAGEVSDEQKKRQKAAFEESEDPVNKVDKELHDANIGHTTRHMGKDVSLMTFNSAEDVKAALEKIRKSGCDAMLFAVADSQQETYDISSSQEEELDRTLDHLRDICYRWGLPAVVQIQTAHVPGGMAMSGFRNVPPTRSSGRMMLFDRILEVLFRENLSQEDFGELAVLVFRILMHRKGKQG